MLPYPFTISHPISMNREANTSVRLIIRIRSSSRLPASCSLRSVRRRRGVVLKSSFKVTKIQELFTLSFWHMSNWGWIKKKAKDLRQHLSLLLIVKFKTITIKFETPLIAISYTLGFKKFLISSTLSRPWNFTLRKR